MPSLAQYHRPERLVVGAPFTLGDDRLPLLLTGIAGVAGYNALHYFRARYPGQVIGIRQRDNWRLIGEGVEVCNAEDEAGLQELFRRYKFRSVLDCAGNCALKSCELDPEMAWRINVEGVRSLIKLTVDEGIRFVHLSIDLVYSGTRSGWHVETDNLVAPDDAEGGGAAASGRQRVSDRGHHPATSGDDADIARVELGRVQCT